MAGEALGSGSGDFDRSQRQGSWGKSVFAMPRYVELITVAVRGFVQSCSSHDRWAELGDPRRTKEVCVNGERPLSEELAERGFAIARRFVCRELIDELIGLCSQSNDREQMRRRGGSLYGIRNLLSAVPRLREVVASSPFIELARSVLGEAARPVKGVYFDKTPEANWPVPWHQDVTITVREHRDVAGYEMRPVKEGLVHALPPIEVSEQMLALRIHLDDAGADHGALRVIPGSHRGGRHDATQTAQWLTATPEVVCMVQRGDVMLMQPLLLHCSSACHRPEHRRVIHIEYAAIELPGGLEWAG